MGTNLRFLRVLGLEDNLAITSGVALTLALDLGGHVGGNLLPRVSGLFGSLLSRLVLLFGSQVRLLVLLNLSGMLSKQCIELLATSGASGLLSLLLLSGLRLELSVVLLLPSPEDLNSREGEEEKRSLDFGENFGVEGQKRGKKKK